MKSFGKIKCRVSNFWLYFPPKTAATQAFSLFVNHNPILTIIFQVKTVSYDLPTNAIASGNCGDKESSITLSWTEGVANLALSMMLENGDSKWETSSLAFTANAGNQTLIINGTG